MAAPYNAVDAHTHLDFDTFDPDRDAVVQRARDAGIERVVIAGADPAHWTRLAELAESLDAYCCLGIHPWWVRGMQPEQLQDELARLDTFAELDGIGETGLDWFRARSDDERAAQRASFAGHVELAHHRNLPLVMHVVQAHADALGMLAALDVPPAGGMIHAWSAGPEWVEPALDLGLYLSFGTDLQRSERARRALREVPLDRLLLETDCPDRPLEGLDRGEPAHLVQIAEIAAEIRDTSAENLLARCGENARTLFDWMTDV